MTHRSTLDELGFDWAVKGGAEQQYQSNGFPLIDDQGNPVFSYQRQGVTNNNRSLSTAFSTGLDLSAVKIDGTNVASNAAPSLTSVIDLANTATNAFTASGWSVAGADVDLAIRALSRKTGSDLMSAPKVTVLSGKRATITVAQELRYPESYGDIESTVSSEWWWQ